MTETIPAEVIEKMAEEAGTLVVRPDGRPMGVIPLEDHRLLAALKAAEAAGYVLVPVEATEEMVRALELADHGPTEEGLAAFWRPPIRAMIAARPKVP